ncbi:MAG: hypothetical protein EXX96DRAFT_646812 [Benjaminiella poitrasii]|nr:MAG: hypothetical protein EXX96DRAFT_646812 [Benjaminiella poitrasii]
MRDSDEDDVAASQRKEVSQGIGKSGVKASFGCIYLHWINERTLEAKTNESSQSRPDLCVTKCCGVNWSTSLAYGEARLAVHSYNNYLLCMDLINVATFCKEVVDKQLFEGILGIQIIDRMVVFYLLTLPSHGLYTLIPLASIKIPDSIQSLPALITKARAILKVLDVFDRLCVRATRANVISDRYAPTLPIGSIQQLFSESKKRKRQCVLQQEFLSLTKPYLASN